jgi:AcrR family transcriptional regulator
MSRTTDRTREKILEAGFQLFFRDGYARVGMEMIAAQAGITKRSLYNHFDSKDRLLGAVMETQSKRSLARFKGWTGNRDGRRFPGPVLRKDRRMGYRSALARIGVHPARYGACGSARPSRAQDCGAPQGGT